MTSDLTPARARETASAKWLASYCGTFDPESMRFSAAELRRAFEEGMNERLSLGMMKGDHAAWTALTLRKAANAEVFGDYLTAADCDRAATVVEFLWNDMGEARRLIEDAASLFRMYGKHHRDQAEQLRNKGPVEAVAFHDRIAKASRNEAMAARLERWLHGDPDNPAEVLRKIAEGMVDGVNIKGVVHEDFDRAAAQLEEPGFKIERVEIEDGGVERTVLTGWEYQGEDALGRGVWHRPGEDGYVGTTITTDPDKAPDWLEPADGTTVVEDMEDAIALTSRPLRPYGPDDCDFPIGGRMDLSFVTSREQAQRMADRQRDHLLRRHYSTRGDVHPLYSRECRAEPPAGGWPDGDPGHTAEACRARFDNIENFSGFEEGRPSQAGMEAPAPGIAELRAYVHADHRTWVEKATDWVRWMIDGPGYRRGGFVKDGLDRAMPDIRPAMRKAVERAASNVRPVTIGPLADPKVADALAGLVTDDGSTMRALSTVKAGAFRLQTPDPRFDPAAPVMINGYLFKPTTKGE